MYSRGQTLILILPLIFCHFLTLGAKIETKNLTYFHVVQLAHYLYYLEIL